MNRSERLRAKLDPAICRLQFPDGSVPTDVESCAIGWKRRYEEMIGWRVVAKAFWRHLDTYGVVAEIKSGVHKPLTASDPEWKSQDGCFQMYHAMVLKAAEGLSASHEREHELIYRTALAALEMAADDMAEWRQLARRQYDEMPHNAALCPTRAGIEQSEERSRIVARAIALCREAIQSDDKDESRQTA